MVKIYKKTDYTNAKRILRWPLFSLSKRNNLNFRISCSSISSFDLKNDILFNDFKNTLYVN